MQGCNHRLDRCLTKIFKQILRIHEPKGSVQFWSGSFYLSILEKKFVVAPLIVTYQSIIHTYDHSYFQSKNSISKRQRKNKKMFKVKIDSTCFTFIDQKKTEYGNYQVCMKKFQTFYWFTIYIFTIFDLRLSLKRKDWKIYYSKLKPWKYKCAR